MFRRPALLMRVAALPAAMTTLCTAMFMGSPIAGATEADEQFLAVVAGLGLQFGTLDEAIAAGNNICDIAAEGSANGISTSEIRGSIVESLEREGLNGPAAVQLMLGAVSAYCPQYRAVVGG